MADSERSPASPSSPAATRPDAAHRYTGRLANELEPRHQARWAELQVHRAPNPGDPDFDSERPKFYCLDMFPYPSGAGLHVGHPLGYVATDVVSRHRRMKGFTVLHPMGWDAFGLPAEQYAVQNNIHPAITTRNAIDTFRAQLTRLGLGYDWSREIETIDPEYYRWTQWIWLQAYHAWYDETARRARPIAELLDELGTGRALIGPSGEIVRPGVDGQLIAVTGEASGLRRWHEVDPDERRDIVDGQRLAYLGEQTVNWCPKLGTVLANEEVIDGRSERGGHPVKRVPMRQWMFRITAYAERLLDDLALIDWPESTRIMQTEWIGRSEGAEIDFALPDVPTLPFLRVYTTRPDTLFGATYMVIAPEHPLVDVLLEAPMAGVDADALRAYREQAAQRADVDRIADTKEKTGVPTGVTAINPATGERIPVWVADYVLGGYGHGAIMAVPAHDQRDFEFAVRFGLPIRDVVLPVALMPLRALALAGGATALPHAEQVAAFVEAMLGEGSHEPDAALALARQVPGSTALGAVRAIDLLGETTRDSDPASPVALWRDACAPLGDRTVTELIDAVGAGRLATLAGAAELRDGLSVNSAGERVSIDGLATDEAKSTVVAWLERAEIGRRKVNYRLRDWLFSRQRYWGEPFPIVYDRDGNHWPVRAEALPVRLPELEDFRPVESDTPTPPLGRAKEWVETTAGEAGVDPELLPPDTPVRRETNTMPNWAGSCWYYLRFCDPHNTQRFVGREAERHWMTSQKRDGTPHAGGIDLYVGGAEHAVLHLLYARFWHKLLFDLGEVSTPEPVGRLYHQGMITAYAYQRPDKSLVPADAVEERPDGTFVERDGGGPVAPTIAKMSKTLKNVVNPDDVIAEYGADTFRLYEMYMGPLDASKPWNPRDIVGPFRFLQRLWRLAIDEETGAALVATEADGDLDRLLHRTIHRVDQDLERMSMNTAIAALIEFVNAATTRLAASADSRILTRDQIGRLARALAAFAPHIAEELWTRLGEEGSIVLAPWPAVDPAMLVDDSVELPVAINGKVRHRVVVPADADASTIERLALDDERVRELMADKSLRKAVVVPGKMVNLVVG